MAPNSSSVSVEASKRRKKYVLLSCVDCPVTKEVPSWYAKNFTENGYRCRSCANRRINSKLTPEVKLRRSKVAAKGRAEWAVRNPEVVSAQGKNARAAVKISGAEMRARQQKTIDGDLERRATYCAKRKKIALDFHAGMSPEKRDEHYAKVFAAKGISRAETEFVAAILAAGIVVETGRSISGFFPDAVVKDNKVVIEFFGDAHHCHPNKFPDPTVYCSWISRTVGEQWKRDEMRKAVFRKNGYETVVVWQSDWIRDSEAQIACIRAAIQAACSA